jgi:hypothetical protein
MTSANFALPKRRPPKLAVNAMTLDVFKYRQGNNSNSSGAFRCTRRNSTMQGDERLALIN